MNWFIENWSVIVGAVAAAAVLAVAVIGFFKLPVTAQKEKIKEWLLYAVTEAERILGGGTGALKLRIVFEWFSNNFKWVSKIISFETFSGWVDEALDKMKDMLDNNESVYAYVNGDDTNEEN